MIRAVLVAGLLTGCSNSGARVPSQPGAMAEAVPVTLPCSAPTWRPPPVTARAVWSRTFERPLWAGVEPGTERRIVVEQGGLVYAIAGDGEPQVFGNLSDRVTRKNNEEGLLAMAFHPRYTENARAYLYYSVASPRRTRLVEVRVVEGRIDLASERELLAIPQPYGNHNGGDLRFGPDGYLYLSVGDGGAGGDPLGHGQNTHTLLGTILRLDVDGSPPYAIPSDNPFADGRLGRPEIFAWGLRNPWRMAFDGDDLWVGDVGQNATEEVDIVRRGGNYGWNLREGAACFGGDCSTEGLVDPVWTYGRDKGTSITGGLVYRGRAHPELLGTYLVADFVSRRLWAVCPGKPARGVELLTLPLMPASFAVDVDGEPLIVGFGEVSGVKLARVAGG